MTDKLKGILIALAAVAALVVGGAAIAGATGGGGTAGERSGAGQATENEAPGTDDDGTEKAIEGSALDRASRIALARVGDGKVTGTEVADEQGYYEIEVTRASGGQVDVHLDRDFNVLDVEGDGNGDG